MHFVWTLREGVFSATVSGGPTKGLHYRAASVRNRSETEGQNCRPSLVVACTLTPAAGFPVLVTLKSRQMC
jgi:hypothetical protein